MIILLKKQQFCYGCIAQCDIWLKHISEFALKILFFMVKLCEPWHTDSYLTVKEWLKVLQMNCINLSKHKKTSLCKSFCSFFVCIEIISLMYHISYNFPTLLIWNKIFPDHKNTAYSVACLFISLTIEYGALDSWHSSARIPCSWKATNFVILVTRHTPRMRLNEQNTVFEVKLITKSRVNDNRGNHSYLPHYNLSLSGL